MKNKYLRYTLKGIIILLSVFLLLYIIVFAYVTANKQKIIKQVTTEISKKLNGEVTIGNVELSFFRTFPKVSVALHDVQITDTMFAQHHHPFFTGQDVFVKLGVVNMIRKKSFITGFRIDNASIYVFTDTSGYTNKYLFSPRRDTVAGSDNNTSKNELKSIVLNNVRLIEEDKRRNKFFDIQVDNLDLDLEDKDDAVFLFSAKANMLVHSLAFNTERGSFLKEKTFKGNFDLKYDKKLKQIQLDNAPIKLDGHSFKFTARFDMAGDNRQFSVKILTNDIKYKFARSLLTHKIDSALAIGDVEKPLDVVADLSGPLKRGNPLITVNFSAKKTKLKTPFIDFEDASFKGYFTNEVMPGLPRLDPNSKIVLKDFTAIWQELPVTSDKIEVVNLVTPFVDADLKTAFGLTKLNDILGSNAIQLTSGEGSANITYKGPIQRNNNTNSFVNGFVNFKNATVLYAPRDVELKSVNGRIVFKNSNVFVENLQGVVLGNKIVMNGRALNLLTLIDAEPNKVNVEWNIFSPSLNLNAFTFLLQGRKKAVEDPNAKRKLVKLSNNIDRVLDQGIVSVNVKANQLIYKKFVSTNANLNITLLQDRYLINNVSMDHAGGRMEIKGSLVQQNGNSHTAKINVSLDNVDVSKTLTAFNNFGQDGITDKSLSGQLTAKVDASLNISNDGAADPQSILSTIDFSLKNGELNNYEPIKKIQKFIFKKRDFENIRFAELKNRLEVKNGVVKINRMEIQSSVMTMFVEGVFSPKGSTDISIQVPLSNLKKREADFNPENIGTEAKTGRSVYLRGQPGPDGNIKFKLDLFNKFKKEKEKEAEKVTQE